MVISQRHSRKTLTGLQNKTKHPTTENKRITENCWVTWNDFRIEVKEDITPWLLVISRTALCRLDTTTGSSYPYLLKTKIVTSYAKLPPPKCLLSFIHFPIERKNVQLWCKLAFHYQCNFFFWNYNFTCIQIIFILQLHFSHSPHLRWFPKTYSSYTKRQRRHIHNKLCSYLGPERTKCVRQNGLDF